MSTTTVSATNGSVAVGSIQVGGNVEGSIVVGHHNFVVNTNHGTIVYNAPAGPVIKRREVKPQPPRAPLDFFDRASELTQVEQLVRQGKPVAICGADGAGKSALLRQAANGTAAHTLPDGVILLEGLDEHGNTLLPGDVIQRWFDAFYLSEPHLKVTSASAQPYLSQLRPLLLLDHVTLDADQLRPLLDLFPNSPALIARPSALPGLARPIKLGALPRSDAMELFSATSGLLIDDANRSTCDAICALLNDVPLAIVRAADVIREMNLPLDQAQARLEAAPSAAGDNIAIGLSRAVALIRSVLTPLEEQILEAAANLPGLSIDPQTMASIISGQPSTTTGGQIQAEGEWVIVGGVRVRRRDGAARSPSPSQGEGRGEGSVEAAIEHLKALGLLHANSPRVRMDAGLREFWSGDGNAIKDRLLAQLLIDQLNGRFGDDTFCANELGHVLGAIDHAVQTQQWTAATALSRAIDRYVTLHGLWDAWGQIADRVLQSARAAGDRSNEAWALHQLGTRAIASDKAQAIDLLKQALSVRQAIGETTAAAYTQHNLDVLIPPPIPPKGGEGTIGPKGMSGVAKIIFIAAVIVGVLAIGGLALSQLSTQPATPTTVVAVVPPHTPTHAPSHTPTSVPRTPTPVPSHTPTNTPTAMATATSSPTPTETSTPVEQTWPIVYFSGSNPRSGYEVFTINSDGTNPTQITKGLPEQVAGCYFRSGTATLSPDGKQIAYIQFSLNSAGLLTSRLHLMNADGSDVRTVTGRVEGILLAPSWSPDSSQVAVGVDGEKDAIEIFDQNGKLVHTIGLKELARQHFRVTWSPDSKQIMFNDGDRVSSSFNIFAANADGSDKIQLTRNEQGAEALLPAWSPDGKRIVFLENANGQLGLRVIATDGTSLATFPPYTDQFAWSPDSTQIAVIENSPDGQSLSIVDVNSGTVTRLVDELGYLIGPAWSPDGKQIAFASFNTQSYQDIFGKLGIQGGAARSDIYVIDAGGSQLRKLTDTPRQDNLMAIPWELCAQCPYVYTYRADRQEWAYDTTILYQLVGKQNERLQVRALQNFDGRLLIREVEPEISYIDQLYVIVTDGDGHAHTLPAQIDRLRDADGRYVVLRTGDELLVTFEGFDQIRSPQQASVAAKGYYDPLAPSLVPVP